MQGIYIIADAQGRVYYVGRSKHLDTRSWDHLRKLETKNEVSKMYEILREINKIEKVGCYVVEESLLNLDLQKLEKKYIQEYRPVLNTLVPKDCIAYIDQVHDGITAITLAEQHGRISLEAYRQVW